MFLLILPWLWIAAALIVLACTRRSARPETPRAFAMVLVAMGLGDFFLNPSAGVQWWLLGWKGLCVAVGVGIYLRLRLSRPKK